MKMRLRFLYLLLLPLAVAALTWSVRYAWDVWPATAILNYPSTVDLGEREFGEVAVGRFTIANHGRRELLLDQFSTSCSCAGVEREVDGEFQRLESLSLPPREQVELAVRVSVGVEPGERQLVQVGFASNDPVQPVAKIEVLVPRVIGGTCAVPKAILFGAVRVGGMARQVVDLYDNRRPNRRIEGVRSSHPELLRIRLLPLESEDRARTHDVAGRLIARLEVVGQTALPGPLDGRIEVSLAGEERRPDIIPVFGEVVHTVECRPEKLILPRRAGDRLVYSGQLLLRHRDGRSIKVEVEHVPSGITAKVRPSPDSEDQCWLDVECTPSQAVPSIDQVIRLRVRSDLEESLLEAPVRVITEKLSEGQ